MEGNTIQMEHGDIERFEHSYLAITRKLKELVRHHEFGLTGPQFFMMYLIQKKGHCKITEMAEMMEVKPSAVTVMIDRLVHSGYVARKQDQQDRRIVWVELTDKGNDVFRQVQAIRKAFLQQLLSHLQPAERENFITTFEKLTLYLSDKEST